MDLSQHPELAERLAAAYALGSLRGGARRRFEEIARQSPRLRANVLTWQERLAAMTELQPELAPSPNVWKRIAIDIRRETPAHSSTATAPSNAGRAGWFRQRLAFAGGLAAVLAFALGAYIGAPWLEGRGGPEIGYVAMLQDQHAAPAMLVTLDDRHGRLTVRRLGDWHTAPDRSLQLWALAPEGPRSLGVLGPQAELSVPVDPGALRQVPALAISLEPLGGAPAGSGPTGPVLFKGAWAKAT